MLVVTYTRTNGEGCEGRKGKNGKEVKEIHGEMARGKNMS
jgi:hypothetical protein